ncbi:unnamed protein product, partial [Ectocarpus fasciculatus]
VEYDESVDLLADKVPSNPTDRPAGDRASATAVAAALPRQEESGERQHLVGLNSSSSSATPVVVGHEGMMRAGAPSAAAAAAVAGEGDGCGGKEAGVCGGPTEQEMHRWLSDEEDEEEEVVVMGHATRRTMLAEAGRQRPEKAKWPLADVSFMQQAEGVEIHEIEDDDDDDDEDEGDDDRPRPRPAFRRRSSRSLRRRSLRRCDNSGAAAAAAAAAAPSEADDEADDDRPEFVGLTVIGGKAVDIAASDSFFDRKEQNRRKARVVAGGAGNGGAGAGGGVVSGRLGSSPPPSEGCSGVGAAAAAAAAVARSAVGFPSYRVRHHVQSRSPSSLGSGSGGDSISGFSPATSPTRTARQQQQQQRLSSKSRSPMAAAAVGGERDIDGNGVQVEIAPPLLGKFQSLVLDNRDIEGLARCLPRPAADNNGDRRPATGGATGGGDTRPRQQQQQQQQPRVRPDLSLLNVADMNSGYHGVAGGGDGGGKHGSPGDSPRAWAAVEHGQQPLDSPGGNSLISFGSSTTMADDEVTDFLLESNDGVSFHPENDGG